jgi:hypothetical protein
MVAVIPLCKILEDKNLKKEETTCGRACLYIKMKGNSEVTFFLYSRFSNFVG